MFRVRIGTVVGILSCLIAPGCMTSAAWEALTERPLVGVSGISVSQEAITDADVVTLVVTVAYVDGFRSSERWQLKACQDPELVVSNEVHLEEGQPITVVVSQPARQDEMVAWLSPGSNGLKLYKAGELVGVVPVGWRVGPRPAWDYAGMAALLPTAVVLDVVTSPIQVVFWAVVVLAPGDW